MTQFVDQFSRLITGPGHDVEDGKPTPIIFRDQVSPLSGSGSPQPQAGQAKTVTGSPYAGHNPLPR